MPQYTCELGDDTLFVDTSLGVATYRGMSYHHSCTLERTVYGEPCMTPIPPAFLVTIDFSRVRKVDVLMLSTHLGDVEWLAIDLAEWNAVFLKKRCTPVAAVAGSKRCMC